MRHVRGGMGSLEGEIAGFEAHISVLGFWALVASTTQEELNHSRSLTNSSMRPKHLSHTHNLSSMQLESRVSKSQSHALQRLNSTIVADLKAQGSEWTFPIACMTPPCNQNLNVGFLVI